MALAKPRSWARLGRGPIPENWPNKFESGEEFLNARTILDVTSSEPDEPANIGSSAVDFLSKKAESLASPAILGRSTVPDAAQSAAVEQAATQYDVAKIIGPNGFVGVFDPAAELRKRRGEKSLIATPFGR